MPTADITKWACLCFSMNPGSSIYNVLLQLPLVEYSSFMRWNLLIIETLEEPDGASSKEPTCQCRRHRCVFDPWVGKIPWRRKWQPTPVFLLGESNGQRSLVGYSPCSRKESNMTEACTTHRGTTRRMKSKMLAVGWEKNMSKRNISFKENMERQVL